MFLFAVGVWGSKVPGSLWERGHYEEMLYVALYLDGPEGRQEFDNAALSPEDEYQRYLEELEHDLAAGEFDARMQRGLAEMVKEIEAITDPENIQNAVYGHQWEFFSRVPALIVSKTESEDFDDDTFYYRTYQIRYAVLPGGEKLMLNGDSQLQLNEITTMRDYGERYWGVELTDEVVP